MTAPSAGLRPRWGPRGQLASGVAAGATGGVLAAAPVAAVTVGVGAPFLLLTSLRTKLFGYLVVTAVLGYVEIHTGRHLSSVHVAVAAIAVLALVWELAVRKRGISLSHPLVMLAGMLAGLAAINVANPVAATQGATIPGLSVYLVPIAMFFVALPVLKDPDGVRGLLRVGVLIALVIGAYMLVQLVAGFSPAERTFFAGRTIRVIAEKKLFSTFTAPDVYGYVTVVLLLVSLTARALNVWPRLATLAAVLSLIGTVTCGVRMAVASAVVAGLTLLVQHRRLGLSPVFATRGLIVGLAAVAVLFVAVVVTPAQERTQTYAAGNAVHSAVIRLALLKHGRADPDVSSRIDRLSKFGSYIVHHPEGSGPGVVGLVAVPDALAAPRTGPPLPQYLLDAPYLFHHDFNYVAVGAELGLLGLVVFVLAMLVALLSGLRGGRRATDPVSRAVCALGASTAVLALLYNLTNEAFRAPAVATWTWVIFAGLAVHARRPRLVEMGEI